MHKGNSSNVRSGGGWKGVHNSPANAHTGVSTNSIPSHKPASAGRAGLCHYCHGEGHWKDQCPLRSTEKRSFPLHAPVMCCSAVARDILSSGDPGVAPCRGVCVTPNSSSGFEQFISDAMVSLVGSDKRVPIKVLRDTAAHLLLSPYCLFQQRQTLGNLF